MSLILDALRKSEAERRRGQAPDLYAELPPLVPRTTTRRPLWLWWLAGGLAVLASLWLLRGMTPMAAAVTTPVVESPASPAVEAANDAVTISTPALESAPPRVPGPSIAAAPARLEPTQTLPAQGTVATVATPTPAQAPPLPAQEPVLPPPQAPVPVQAPIQAPVQVASVTAPAAATPPAPAAAAPLRLADLSAGEREQLPALKISMHMWGPTPDQRFAIIDGARVGQGDRVGDAVVEEIAADSVVLNWHGQRVALPIH